MLKQFYFASLFVTIALLAGCAASEAASEDQHNTELLNQQKAVHSQPTGMTNAAKMISPVIN